MINQKMDKRPKKKKKRHFTEDDIQMENSTYESFKAVLQEELADIFMLPLWN